MGIYYNKCLMYSRTAIIFFMYNKVRFILCTLIYILLQDCIHCVNSYNKCLMYSRIPIIMTNKKGGKCQLLRVLFKDMLTILTIIIIILYGINKNKTTYLKPYFSLKAYPRSFILQKRSFHTARLRSDKRIGPHNIDVRGALVGCLLGTSLPEGGIIRFKQSVAYSNYLFFLFNFFHSRGYCSADAI